jgi:hypothetical protein
VVSATVVVLAGRVVVVVVVDSVVVVAGVVVLATDRVVAGWEVVDPDFVPLPQPVRTKVSPATATTPRRRYAVVGPLVRTHLYCLGRTY